MKEHKCNHCGMTPRSENHSISEESLEEMVETCVKELGKEHADMEEAQARQIMKDILPTLKKWKEEA